MDPGSTSQADASFYGEGELELRMESLIKDIAELERKVSNLRDIALAYREKVNSLREGVKEARNRVSELQILLGSVPTGGPGLRMRIEDPQGVIGEYEALLIMHELRSSGAEAIVLNGRRVDIDSFVSTDPEGLALNGSRVRSPLVFEAVGDPKTLSASLTLPGGLLALLGRLTGVRVSYEQVSWVDVPPRPGGPRAFTFAKKAE